jgi:sugar phosphate isomerase/epimerase
LGGEKQQAAHRRGDARGEKRMNAPQGLNLGSTLYSFTNEFLSYQYGFEHLVRKVAELDLGPGLEIVGFQSIRGFPKITDDFAARFKDLIAETGLKPSCLGINADVCLRRGQMMSEKESVAYHEPQILAAAKLGFPVVRYQFAAGPGVIRALAPLAERVGVKLGLEIHAPHGVDSPAVMAYREMYAQVNSRYLGFIPDFGASAIGLPPALVADWRVRGIGEQVIEWALELWRSDTALDAKRTEFMRRAEGAGTDIASRTAVAVIFNVLSRQPAEKWLEIMPQAIHIHGKFYGFDDQGNESCIPYDELLPVFRKSGFNGYMSSEWEGHMFSIGSGIDMVRRHHDLCRRVLASS